MCTESQFERPLADERESPVRAIGIVLIVLGIVALAYGGISWTTKDKVIDAGPIEVTKDNRQTVFFPPLAGAVMLIGGAVLVTKK